MQIESVQLTGILLAYTLWHLTFFTGVSTTS